ncbi:separase-like [Dorcoceras hygrometricum]|uniref:Separase-like n=1 Tax=Dorcoceras hygrometricum TaxID=472368 RepID=A0A2Z7B2W6_9LAMI|nr:separase-like [Dorcoceras hygrometricum]
MRNVEQEADNSKRNSEESDVVLKNQQMVRVQQMATVEWIQQKRKDKDSADDIRKDPDATIISATAQRRVKSGQLRRRNDTQLFGCNQRSKWKESMAEIKSCKLPHFKGTRFVLFGEIVQFTEERCTDMERRRRISLDKRRRDLEFI